MCLYKKYYFNEFLNKKFFNRNIPSPEQFGQIAGLQEANQKLAFKDLLFFLFHMALHKILIVYHFIFNYNQEFMPN